MRKTHRGFTMVVAEDDCDGYGARYAEWLRKKYPSLTVEYRPRQSGGSGLFDGDWNLQEDSNDYWTDFCNS